MTFRTKPLASIAFLFISILVQAKDPAVPNKIFDFTKGDSLPKNSSHDWTLGPIGARGWCQVSKQGPEGNTSNSRQILITKVSSNGPSSKSLKKGDVIIGIDDTVFTKDARITFAKAISKAEASPKGKLTLLLFRKGENKKVSITLPTFPNFSPTAPHNCKKSTEILKAGCDALAKRGLKKPSIASHINALALLATGDSKYQTAIKNHVNKTLSKPLSPNDGLSCWPFAFTNIFLSEYYLATRDPSVLKEIQRLSEHLVKGQGPLGTWGHHFADENTHLLRGYGAVNGIGLPVAISLVLARECGLDFDGLNEAISLSSNFFRRHIGIGAIPYGDGPPNLQYGHDDNGKNSAAAILFSLLNDKVATRYYTRTALACYGSDREQGHTGNFLNMLWSMPAVSLAGPKATGAWMKEFSWYYDLARDPNYHFPYQGYPRQQAKNAYASWDCPGAYLLHFATPLKKLRITGKNVSSQPKFTDEEITQTIKDGKINYKSSSPEFLTKALSSWSPIVRQLSAKELKRRKTNVTPKANLKSSNPLDRIAALRTSKNFQNSANLLSDSDLRVRIAALTNLAEKNKSKALNEIFSYIVKNPKESPVFMQAIGNTFFPLGINPKKVGELLNYPKDRQMTIKAIRILLNDEDALVSSRIAMGLEFLPNKELIPLLPEIYKRATVSPNGNIMFTNKLQTSCASALVHLNLQEGMEVSALLLNNLGWGKNNRLPQAAKLLLKYKKHAHDHIPALKNSTSKLTSSGEAKWKQLLSETIEVIEAEKPSNLKLPTIKTLMK